MTNFIIQSGKPKEIVDAWSEQLFQVEEKLNAFTKRIGAMGVSRHPYAPPVGFFFKGDPPAGFKVLVEGTGLCVPEDKNNAMAKEIRDMSWPKRIEYLVTDDLGLPFNFVSKIEGRDTLQGLVQTGSSLYRLAWLPKTGVTPECTILECPDFEASIKDTYGEVRWKPDGTSPDPIEGLEKISSQDLEALKDHVERDRERAASAAAEDDYCRSQVHTRANGIRYYQDETPPEVGDSYLIEGLARTAKCEARNVKIVDPDTPSVNRDWPSGSRSDLPWIADGPEVYCLIEGKKVLVAEMCDEVTAQHVAELRNGVGPDYSTADIRKWCVMHDDHIALDPSVDGKFTYFGYFDLVKDVEFIVETHNKWLEESSPEPEM
jgi:hypothetical protein